MNTKRWIVIGSLVGMALLSACSGLEISVETETPVTVPNEATATLPAPTAPPTAEATSAPEATATEEAVTVLPRPLYFLSTDDQQVWRVEPNGSSITQVTTEREAVTEFDVSADGSALVYVTENQLVRSDADGGNRVVLVTGPALMGDDADYIARLIHNPRWSPDGQQIAFGMNGVNLIPAAGGEPNLIQPSDPIPTVRTLARFYRPQLWSPDGTKLVVAVNFWQEGLIYAVKDLATGALVDIESACCEPSWSADGQSLYMFGSSPEGYNPPGLWRVDPATGQAETLIQGKTDGDPLVRLVAFPHENAAGEVRFLMSEQLPNADGIYEFPPRYQLYTLDAAGQPVVVGGRAYVASWEGAWAPDGSGLAFRELDTSTMQMAGQFIFLKADGTEVRLPAEGLGPRW